MIANACSSFTHDAAQWEKGILSLITHSPKSEELIQLYPADQISCECYRLEEEIELLKAKTDKLEQFFLKHPDLMELVQKHMQYESGFIAQSFSIKMSKPHPDDWLGKRAALRMKLISINHIFQEQLLFIERHEDIYECFKKHFYENKDETENKIEYNLEE